MALPPAMANFNAKQTAAAIFARRNLPLPYGAQELHLTPAHVYEAAGTRAVSDALLERMFPTLPAMELWHFTKPDILPQIIQQKKIRLSSVARHLDANEYRSFLEEHGYSAAESKKLREKLAGCHFYLSCTEVGSGSELSHWNVFADGGDGYRLRLRVSPVKGDLRRIRYRPDERSLLSELDEDLKREIGRTFFPFGVSRVTAFSLRQGLGYEDEVRLMVSNPPRDWVLGSGKERYIEIDFATDNEACRIDLVGVTCGRSKDVPIIKAALNQHGFAGVEVDHR